MKKGILGGTFDPIHYGHLNLAINLFEAFELDQVIFCPSHCSPFKKGTPPLASALDRRKMLELAIDGSPLFSISTLEIERPPPSYMIDTVKAMIEEDEKMGEKNHYFLLLAQDLVKDFDKWKGYEELVELARPLVGTRSSAGTVFPASFGSKVKSIFEKGQCQIPIMEISSTEIRERFKRGLFCAHLVQGKVLDYIVSKKLYSS